MLFARESIVKNVCFNRTPSQTSRILDCETTGRIAAFLRDPVMEPPISENLPQLSDYEIYEHLGTGATGSVYMAIPKSQPETVVAVKIFKIEQGTKSLPSRVLRELDLLTALRLPCVPSICDYGVDQGRFYIATEVVRGMNVDRYCESHNLSREQRVALLAEVASSVQQLHEFGVIHRDIKPSNVMITHDGKPILIDLGIATMTEIDRRETLTAEGLPIGSPGFMAPEQARGERSATTIRSDIYALGAVGCYLLTGQTPHDTGAPLHEMIRRVAEDQPRHPKQLDASIPKALAAILAKATARESSDRFESAAAFASHLQMWLRGEPIAISAPSLFRRFRYRCRRNPLAAASITMAIIAIVAAVYFGNVALAEARLASERSELAEARKVFGEEKEAFALRARGDLERVRSIVAKFVEEARKRSKGSEFGEALALIYGIDHLLAETDFGDPSLVHEHGNLRVTTLVDAIAAVYRTSEHGGEEALRAIRDTLLDLERGHANAKIYDAH